MEREEIKITIICNNCAAIINNVDTNKLTEGKEHCPFCRHKLKAKGKTIAKAS